MNNELSGINKSGTGIHRSGTGIHRSGTGIHRSGTGIKKGGTGLRLPGLMIMLAFVFAAFSANAFGNDPDVFVSERNNSLMLSLHADEGMFVGAVPLSNGQSGYFQIELHQVASESRSGIVVDPLVKGTGTGDSGESADLGGTTQVKGTGTGSSGEAFSDNGRTQVKGTGTGDAGESICGSSGLLVKGTGTGSSGDAAGGCVAQNYDLIAELVIDRTGSHIVVHDLSGNELLVAFVAATLSRTPAGDQPIVGREFVAAP